MKTKLDEGGGAGRHKHKDLEAVEMDSAMRKGVEGMDVDHGKGATAQSEAKTTKKSKEFAEDSLQSQEKAKKPKKSRL